MDASAIEASIFTVLMPLHYLLRFLSGEKIVECVLLEHCKILFLSFYGIIPLKKAKFSCVVIIVRYHGLRYPIQNRYFSSFTQNNKIHNPTYRKLYPSTHKIPHIFQQGKCYARDRNGSVIFLSAKRVSFPSNMKTVVFSSSAFTTE